jgi:hypothetical protein
MSIPGLPDSIVDALSAVRKAYPIVTYQGTDVSTVFQPSLTELVYKESFKDNQLSDTIEIGLADPEGLFRQTWSLATAQTIALSLVMENWNGPGSGTIQKNCGTMYITSVQMRQDKSAGTTIRLTCSSIPPNSSFRLEKKSQAWSNTTLQAIAGQIATANALTLQWNPTTNPQIARADQHDHSDAYMLQKLCSENDFSFKVVNNVLWIRSNEDVESSGAVGTITCPTSADPGGLNGSGIIRWEFKEATEDCNYSGCTVSTKDNVTGRTVTQTTADPNQTGPGPHLVYHYDPHTGALRSEEGITLF